MSIWISAKINVYLLKQIYWAGWLATGIDRSLLHKTFSCIY